MYNHLYVTGSVVSEATELVGTALVAPPFPSSPYKGKRSGGPTTPTKARKAGLIYDKPNGAINHRTFTRETSLRLRGGIRDRHIEVETDNCVPLRLRGGNGDGTQDIDIEINNEHDDEQLLLTPTNTRKRKAGESPPGAVPENITAESMVINRHVNDCKMFLQDMQTATKIGKKWLQGIEEYLAKIQASSINIALEAAVIAGKYQEAKAVASEANRRLDAHLSNNSSVHLTQNKKLYASAVRGNVQNTEGEEDGLVVADTPTPTPAQRRPEKERLGVFPSLQGQSLKIPRKRKKRAAKTYPAKLEKAKSKPVLPAFLVDGNDNRLKLDDIWKVVSNKIPNPRLNGCRRTVEGNFVLTSSDKDTVDAIRSINDVLSIREQGPRKPRIRVKGIPTDYSADFIKDMVISQNRQILGDCTTADIRPLFRCGYRDDSNSDWVIEVSPRAYKSMIGKRIFVGMVSTFPRSYNIAPHCRRCLQMKHKTADCTAEHATCLHCATPGHNRKDCPKRSEKPLCAHCKGQHATMTRECTMWAKTILALQQRTDYGKSNE